MPERCTERRICKQCGSMFLARKSAIKLGAALYCDYDCKVKAQTGKKRGLNKKKITIIKIIPSRESAKDRLLFQQHKEAMGLV